MLISLLPRVTGMKIENAWGRGSRVMVRCTARLSRPLRTKEWHRLEGLPETTVQGRIEVVRECRPDEVEDWQALLSDVLCGEWVAPVRHLALAAGPKPRRERKRNGGRRPEPAA